MLNGHIEVVNKSDVGSTRPHNEDSTASDSGLGFAVVADGMGGYLAGEAASAIAVSSVVSSFLNGLPRLRSKAEKDTIANNSELLRKAIEDANTKVYDTARSEKSCKGMGTTMVAMLFSGRIQNHVCIAHVGDSRLYMLRNNELTQVTKDHSLVQEMIDKGVCANEEEALEFVSKTYITRALGIARDIEVDSAIHRISQGDIYVLCSDGLSDMVKDQDIHRTLVKHSGNLNNAADELIRMANAAGGKDNISTVMVRILRKTDALPKEDTTVPQDDDETTKTKSEEAAKP